MGAGHMVKYHLIIPLGIAAALVVVGVPFGTAIFVGLMTGCMGMMLMMRPMGKSDDTHREGPAPDRDADAPTRDIR